MELARNLSPLLPLTSAVIGFPVGPTGLQGSKFRNHWSEEWRGIHPVAGHDSCGSGVGVVLGQSHLSFNQATDSFTSKTRGYLSSAKKMANWHKGHI